MEKNCYMDGHTQIWITRREEGSRSELSNPWRQFHVCPSLFIAWRVVEDEDLDIDVSTLYDK